MSTRITCPYCAQASTRCRGCWGRALTTRALSLLGPSGGKQVCPPKRPAETISIGIITGVKYHQPTQNATTAPLAQSVHPTWTATIETITKGGFRPSFNSRAPCGARRLVYVLCIRLALVSIHALRAGRGYGSTNGSSWPTSFNPRATCGARLRFILLTSPP